MRTQVSTTRHSLGQQHSTCNLQPVSMFLTRLRLCRAPPPRAHCPSRWVAVALTVLCSCLAGFAQTTNNFFQFVTDQGNRHYSQVPHEVLAVYYVWYGYGVPGDEGWKHADTNAHRTANTARYPLKGSYKSNDPEIIGWHIDQAKANAL